MTEKIKVKEAIVVEGRDDTIAINRAVDGITIETHGFGIRKETWDMLEQAYNRQGLIIFTDPDYSGEEIRRKILKKFPGSKEAFLTRKEATKAGDIGIENACPNDIIKALENSHFSTVDAEDVYDEAYLQELGLIGKDTSKARREKLGQVLGIGYANGKSLLKKLNKYGISKEELEKAIEVVYGE